MACGKMFSVLSFQKLLSLCDTFLCVLPKEINKQIRLNFMRLAIEETEQRDVELFLETKEQRLG